MRAELRGSHTRYRIVMAASLLCSIVAISVLAWSSSRPSVAAVLRPMLIEEQRVGNRHARLSKSENLARLARTGETLEGLRLNLVESIERSRQAADVLTLQIDLEDDDPGTSLDMKGAAATLLRLTLHSTLLHEGALIDLFSIIEGASGAWPMRVKGCSVVRVLADTSHPEERPIRAHCSIEVVHWFWPEAQTQAQTPSLPVVPLIVQDDALRSRRLFNTEQQRKTLDQQADVASRGLLALAQSAQESDDGKATLVATVGNLQVSEIVDWPRQERQGSILPENDSSTNRARTANATETRTPFIVFGGVIRGASSTVVLLNGVPCLVDESGRVSKSCGQRRSSSRRGNAVQKLWIGEKAPDPGRGQQLHVVYADGSQARLRAGEKAY